MLESVRNFQMRLSVTSLTGRLIRTTPGWLLAGIGLCIISACIPVRDAYWKGSIHAPSGMRCYENAGDVHCRLQNAIDLTVGISESSSTPGKAYFRLDIPAGHSVYIRESTVAIISGDPDTRQAVPIVAASGFRYTNPESSEKIEDPPDSSVTREMIGSTWNTHHFAQKMYGVYKFKIKSDRQFPTNFALKLPSFLIDGAEISIPQIEFRYGTWTGVRALFGV